MSRVPELIANLIAESEIDHIFAYPGGLTVPIINAFYKYKDKIKVILPRSEQTASCMANMYGRLTGKPGILICQGPYAISTALFGINESAMGSAPLVLITDITDFGVFHMHGVPQSTSGEYGSLDSRGILKTVCKYVSTPMALNDTVQAVHQAIKHATIGRPGPCAVIFRSFNLSDEVDPDFLPRLFPITEFTSPELPMASKNSIRKALEIIKKAKRPVMIAGNGINVSKAYDELHRFAHLIHAPVATSSMGKGVFDEEDSLSLGVIGSFGHPLANDTIGDADLVIIVGCRLKPSDTCYENPKLLDPKRQKIIHFDIEPGNINWILPVDLGICGDAKIVLSQLIAEFKEQSYFNSSLTDEGIQEIEKRKKENHFGSPLKMDPCHPIHPRWLVTHMSTEIPKGTIVTTDGGNNRFWMLRYFPAKPRCYYSPGGTLSMSYSMPAALTAKLLFPERPVLAVSGDGGFAMQIYCLSTAVQYKLNIVFVVLNDSQLGMVREGQGNHPIGTEFIDTNFAEIARAFGCEGERIDHPEKFYPALRRAFNSKKPYVLDVLTSKEEKIYEQLFSPLARESFSKMTSKKYYYR
jgi:acetolactate synthase-1/2/3 large subunit